MVTKKIYELGNLIIFDADKRFRNVIDYEHYSK